MLDAVVELPEDFASTPGFMGQLLESLSTRLGVARADVAIFPRFYGVDALPTSVVTLRISGVDAEQRGRMAKSLVQICEELANLVSSPPPGMARINAFWVPVPGESWVMV